MMNVDEVNLFVAIKRDIDVISIINQYFLPSLVSIRLMMNKHVVVDIFV